MDPESSNRSDNQRPPLGLRWRSSTLFIVSTVAVGMMTDLSLYCLIIPVLPFLVHDRLGIPNSELQGYTSGLLAAFAAASLLSSPIAGIIADQTNTRQLPFLLGLFALLAATILLAVGQSISVIALARVLQGMSGAVVWTIGLAICLETVGPSKLGTTIGAIWSIISVGTEFSPTLGGILYGKTGFAGVFGVGIALITVDLIMRFLVIEKKTALKYCKASIDSEDTVHEDSDTIHSSLPIHTETTPLLPVPKPSPDSLNKYVFTKPPPEWLRKVSILACVHDPALLTSWLIAFVQNFVIAAFDSTIPIIGSDYYSFDSFDAGLLFLALGGPFFVFGPISGYCVDKFGTKLPTVLGFLSLVPTLACFRLVEPGGTKQIAVYAVLLVLSGIGVTVVGAPSIVEAGAVTERYYKANPSFFGETGPYAQLYGVNSMVVSAGFTFGPLVAGGLKESIGYGNMNAVLAGMCGLTGILCALYIGEWPKSWRKVTREALDRDE